MAETILVLVDIAHTDCAAALLATAKARYESHDLHVAYVMPYGFYSYVEPFVSKESQDNAAERAHAELKELMSAAGLEGANRHVLRGGIGDQILELAKSLNPAILVLNAVRSGSHHSTLGTHSAQIVRHAPCDVHVVRRLTA